MAAIEERLYRVVASVVAVEEDEFTPGASLVNDYNADSFDLVQIAMGIEDAFAISVHPDDLPQLTTVQGALDYIEEKLRVRETREPS